MEDEIVISGISCRFPESDNMAEFAENLLSGKDLLTEDDRRWEPGLYDLPKRQGKLKTINKFDAQFFGIHGKQSTWMDPQLQMLLETAYEAILDAGVNPKSLSGCCNGVFVGASSSETEDARARDLDSFEGYGIIGGARSMFANRLSYYFNFHGPSFTVDTFGTSPLFPLQLAVDSIRNGDCEAALVAGANINLMPAKALRFMRLNMLSRGDSNACRSFAANGDGFALAEGIGAVLLQKLSAARRNYVTVVHIKTNTDGYKETKIPQPNGALQTQILNEVYSEACIDPNDIAFLETDGTGSLEGDSIEADAICQVLCSKRQHPLLVGSVKSIMGHALCAGGIASIAKVIIAIQNGIIPPNLHYTEPSPYIPALVDGRLQVVTEPLNWEGGIVGISSFGLGGSTTHIILKSPSKPNAVTIPTPCFPKLLLHAGRTKDGMTSTLNTVRNNSNNPFFHELLYEVANLPTSICPYRGFTLVDAVKMKSYDYHPVWYIFSGIGTHWSPMGKKLMVIKHFHDSIDRCSYSLRPLGIDPYLLIMNDNEETFRNILNSLVCIMAIQIALTDLLNLIGMKPDGIIGHSTGEIACAYADGCLTLNQAMLITYYLGQTIVNYGLNKDGAMTTVGLTWEETKKCMPEGVYAVCHNGHDSVTTSGKLDDMNTFINQLKSQDVYVQAVDSSGVSFHSPMMEIMKLVLTKLFSEVIPTPKFRSDRWISTSIPEENWNDSLAKTCCADYFINNILSPVHFYEALQKIPPDAVIVEVAPHCLMQEILRHSLPETSTNIGLMERDVNNQIEHLLQSFGQIYQAGVTVNPKHLYPAVNGIVPSGTPMIGPLIQWDHSQDYVIVNHKQYGSGTGAVAVSCAFNIDPFGNKEDEYLLDHVVDGKALLPFVGYVYLAWNALCKFQQLNFEQTPVILHEITVFRPTVLIKATKVNVTLLPQTGHFEITDPEDEGLLSNGQISIITEESEPDFYDECDEILLTDESDPTEYKAAGVYKELLIRGYEYGPHFQGIQSLSNNGHQGIFKWTGKWISFLDSFLQAAVLAYKSDSLVLPVRLQYLRIDPQKHLKAIQEAGDFNKFENRLLYEVWRSDEFKFVHYFADFDTWGAMAGGIEMRHMTVQTIPVRGNTRGKLIIEKMFFVKNHDNNCLDNHQGVRKDLQQYKEMCLTVLSQGLNKWKLNGLDEIPSAPLFKKVTEQLQTNANVNQSALEIFLNDKTCTLIQYLHKLFGAYKDRQDEKTPTQALSDFAQEMLPKLEQDKLWSSSFLQRSIKPLFDTAMQNTPGHSIKCGWLEPTNVINIKTAIELQITHPLIEPEWFLFGPNVDLLDLKPVQYYTCSVVKGNIENSSNFGDNCTNLDIVVADKILSTKTNISNYISKMKELMRDDGLAIVIEIVSDFELALAVHALQGYESHVHMDNSHIYGRYMKHTEWLAIFENSGLQVIGFQNDPSMITCAYLLHKVPPKERNPLFVNVDDVNEFSWITPLQKETEERVNEPESETIWLYSTEVRDNGTVGLALSLREESSMINRFRFLTDVSLIKRNGIPALVVESELVQKAMKEDQHSNIYRDGHFGNFLNMVATNDEMCAYKDTEYAYIDILSKGDLSTLRWTENAHQYWNNLSPKPPNRHICSVYYSSILFRDVMIASGVLPQDAIPNVAGHFDNQDCALGMEYAGRLDDGQRVIGVIPCKALATKVITNATLTWKVPDVWSLCDAVTVPVAYVTAYYSLICRANLSTGERILIHSGSGGLGQASIRIALSKGCEVFTTVGNDEKKLFLQKLFPQLKDRHFSSSRTTEFGSKIMDETNGKGVDVVMNSLSGNKLVASLNCLSDNGRFIELGKVDLFKDTKLKSLLFNKNISFHGILIDSLWDRDGECSELERFVREGIDSGVVQPFPLTLFGRDQVEDAFRYMASGKHIGKVVVEIRPEESYFCPPPAIKVRALCRTVCHPQHVYLITGGLGGFGLELMRFLVSRGAKKLVLTSRQGMRNQFQHNRVSHCRKLGASVVICTSDISTEEGTQELIQKCQLMGPIGGVFHLAMVLRDSLFEDQTAQNFKTAAIAKYWGAKHLDKCTRQMCDTELKWFVAFSSMSSSRGNAGQSCYAWANSAMERVMEQRYADGLPGMAIQWGAIGDVGIILDNLGNNSTVVGGTLPQRVPSCLKSLDMFLSWNHPVVSCFIRADLDRKEGSGQQDIIETIAHIMGVNDPSQLDMNTKLTSLGLDSLMGVEIKQVIEKDYKIVLSMKDMRNLTLAEMKKKIESGESTATEAIGVTMQELAEYERTELAQLFKLRMNVDEFLTYDHLIKMNDVSNGPLVFFIHSIEGIASPLKWLASQLPFPAYCFQCTPDVPTESITYMANYYIKVMKDHQPTGPFNLVGYSFGASVAFEMVGILQKEDASLVDNVIFLDGSHQYMKTFRKIYHRALNLPSDSLVADPGFEVEVLSSSVLRVANIDSKKLRLELLQQPDWKARVLLLTDRAMETGLFKARENVVWACNAIRNKFLCADKYDPSHKFDGTLTLIRAKTSMVREEDCGHDYGIGEVASDPQVFIIDGDHETIVQGQASKKTAKILTEIIKKKDSH